MSLEPLPEIEFWATRYRVLREFCPAYGQVSGGVFIDEVRQKLGGSVLIRYAVRMRDGWALSHSGEWDYEPQPSSRTDEWLDAHRWDDLHSARKAASEAAKVILASVT